MATILLSVLVFALIIAGMAIGVILQNKPIKGSCGGLSAVGLDGECDICGGDLSKCEEETKRTKEAMKNFDPSLVKDAMK